MASDKFEVGDILVCVDDSPYAKISGLPCLVKDKAYEVTEARSSGDVRLKDIDSSAWISSRFRRATLGETRKYRKEQGYEKHQFAVGDLVVCLVSDPPRPLSIGQTCVVSATKSDYEHEGFVDIDGGEKPGQYFAAYFRKATPAEAAAYYKAKEKATAACVAGCDIKPGQLVTVSISDKPSFQAVVLEAPTASDPLVKLSRTAGIDWASAEVGPSFNLTFTWDGPEKMPLTGNDSPEAINKAIAVPNPQMLTSADGREFDIIDWKPTVSTGEVVKVEANMMVRQAKEKPKSLYDGLVGAWAAKPAASAWQPKPGDLVVCIDAKDVSYLSLGTVYKVTVSACNSTYTIGLDGHSLYYRIDRFRPATPEETCDYHKEKGFPDHQFNVGDIVVAVDVRMADGTRLAPHFAIGSVHEVVHRSGIGIRVSGCDLQGFWNVTRFRPATHEERLQFLRDKKRQGGPDFGYRFLDKEEIVDEGDEFWDADARKWFLAMKVGLTASTLDLYRRRNKFAEGELVQIIKPATEQEQDSDPVWTPMMDLFDGAVFPMPATDPITSERDGILHAGWAFATDWLAPATKAQKAQKAKKAKIQELEDKMKAIQSELSSLKGT